MAFVIADRVRESSTTTGTGNFTLGGAVTGYQTFGSVLTTGDTTYYTIADQGGSNWEVGIGTFTSPSTLARTTILSSSNGGSVVTFTAGTKDVFISLPASKTNVEDQPNLIEVNSSSAALRITQTGTGNALVVEDSANPDATPFVVDASGNVGIGTTTPTALLDVNGSVAITGTARRITGDFSNATQTSRIFFQTTTSGGGTSVGAIPNATGANSAFNAFGSSDPANSSYAQLRAGSDTSDVRLTSGITGTGTYYPFTFYAGGSERMRLDTSGNVGIGTSSPNKSSSNVALTVNAALGQYPALELSTNNVGRWYINADATNVYDVAMNNTNRTFYTGGSERIRIDTSGNVGIGTTSPSGYRVRIVGASGVPQFRAGTDTGSYLEMNGYDSNPFYCVVGGSSVTSGIFGTQANIPTVFFTNNTERARIDTSGNALINTTTAVSKLTVNGDVAGTFFVNPTTVSANYTIPTNYNAMTAGPITINSGVVVTVGSGSVWTVV